MSIPILATKLYIPTSRSKFVQRPRLIERLQEGASHKLTLISAPAGSGKTTLLGTWIAGRAEPTAWLSLDNGDNDPARFLTYLIAALRTVRPDIGHGMLDSLQAPQPPSSTAILTTLLNEIATLPDHFALVLDDYHVIDTKPVEQAVTFLIEHLHPKCT
jgi:LuxR family maltose regulon positive regulatory protein